MNKTTLHGWIQTGVIFFAVLIATAIPMRLLDHGETAPASTVQTAAEPESFAVGAVADRQGIFDTVRDAKALIHDARSIIDQAQKDGEVTVKVKLPSTPPTASFAPPAQSPTHTQPPPLAATGTAEPGEPESDAQEQSGCAGGACGDGWYFGKRIGRRR